MRTLLQLQRPRYHSLTLTEIAGVEILDPHLCVLGQLGGEVAVVRGHSLAAAHLPGTGQPQRGDGGRPGGQG